MHLQKLDQLLEMHNFMKKGQRFKKYVGVFSWKGKTPRRLRFFILPTLVFDFY